MEIWIEDQEIIDRIKDVILELSDEVRNKYLGGNLAIEFDSILDGKNNITHNFIIEFCMLTNVSYKYLTLGSYPVFDADNKNNLYRRLVSTKDYTI